MRAPKARRWITGLAFAGLLAGTAQTVAGAALPAVEPAPSPAMWSISDEDTTIFLFGTFHALDRDTGWFSNVVRAAFNHSDELVLETVVPSDPAELFASLSRQSLAGEAKVGEPVIATSRPNSGFVDTSTKAMSAGRSVGMSVDNGADSVLRREAQSNGKRIDGLESFDFQLAMFSSLPSPPKSASNPIPGQGDMASAMQTMKTAWKRGDSTHIAAVLGAMEQQSPETYRRLFTERNTRWAEWVARRMQRPGVVFVAVGSGHLIGRDSVQQRLTERGYELVRVS